MNKENTETKSEEPIVKKIDTEKSEEKINEKKDVPDYTGPRFYGTDHPRTEGEGNTSNESLHDLIEKNIKWSQVIYNQNKKIKRRLNWMVFGSYFRLFLILAPILLGVFYLPEILAKFNEYFGQYLGTTGFDLSSLLHNASSTNSIDASQLQKLLQATK